MTIPHLLLPSRAHDELGDAGIALLLRYLWPGDCQSCGEPLGQDPPAVLVDELLPGHLLHVMLHHPRCWKPAWNTNMILMPGTLSGSYQYQQMSFTNSLDTIEQSPGEPLDWPVIMINPSLETVLLEKDGSSSWHIPPYGTDFTRIDSPGGEFAKNNRTVRLRHHGPIPGTDDPAHNQHYTVTVNGEPAWRVNLRRSTMPALITLTDGVEIILTHAILPLDLQPATDDHSERLFEQAMQTVRHDPTTFCAWASLEPGTRPAPTRFWAS